MELDYTVPATASFDEVVDAVVRATEAAGFRVLCTHDVSATLAEKGFDRERVSIVEICNARYASAVLAADIRIGLMLPCPIMVYADKGQVFVSTMRPTLISSFFPDAGIDSVAREVEDIIVRVIDQAAAA